MHGTLSKVNIVSINRLGRSGKGLATNKCRVNRTRPWPRPAAPRAIVQINRVMAAVECGTATGQVDKSMRVKGWNKSSDATNSFGYNALFWVTICNRFVMIFH